MKNKSVQYDIGIVYITNLKYLYNILSFKPIADWSCTEKTNKH